MFVSLLFWYYFCCHALLPTKATPYPILFSASCFALWGWEILLVVCVRTEGKSTLEAHNTFAPTHQQGTWLKPLVPMATRQLGTSKLFQPPCTTSSIPGDNHKPQVLKQRMGPTRLSPWSNQGSWICRLMLSEEPKELLRILEKTKRLGAISLWN